MNNTIQKQMCKGMNSIVFFLCGWGCVSMWCGRGGGCGVVVMAAAAAAAARARPRVTGAWYMPIDRWGQVPPLPSLLLAHSCSAPPSFPLFSLPLLSLSLGHVNHIIV